MDSMCANMDDNPGIPAITTYKCRILRDGEWKNSTLQLMQIDKKDANKIVCREDKNNLIYGNLFETRYIKIKKYMKAYKEWEKEEKRKKVKTNNPYFVPDFSFHSKYREMLFNIVNLDQYITEYRIRSGLSELNETDLFDMIMYLYKIVNENCEHSTIEQKWDKLRELIRHSNT